MGAPDPAVYTPAQRLLIRTPSVDIVQNRVPDHSMLAKRIIPCLDVTGGRVVKGVNFVELRDAGDPVEIAARYNDQGADELTFLDITATSDATASMMCRSRPATTAVCSCTSSRPWRRRSSSR
jgi:hypothetical protein